MTYDNPTAIRHLIYTYLSNLLQCDAAGKQLEDLYLKILRLVRQYVSITPGSPEYGLGAFLYNKLPNFVKARVYDRTYGQKNLTPMELMELLSDVVKKESTLRTAEERRDATRRNKLFFKCLRADHRTTDCKRPPSHLCNYHHHPALCYKEKLQKVPANI